MVARAPIALPLLVVAAVVALGWNLGGYHLLDPDEGRNAEVAREMVASGDYVVPHLDGLPYLDKPVLYFAAAAAAIKVLGPTEIAVRLPALLATIATVALLITFARRRWGATAGWVAGLSFATMPMALGYAHVVLFDSTLTLSTTAAMVALAAGRPALAWGAVALGALTKGPVALAVPAVAIVPYAVATGTPARRFVSWGGLAVFAGVALPWFGTVWARFPEFPGYVFGRETLLRFATPAFHRWAPMWYYIPILAAGAFPWIIPACAGLGRWRAAWRARRQPGPHEAILLGAWVVGPFLLFTLDQSKLPQYVLPLLPPLALAAAREIAARGAGTAWRAYLGAAVGVALALLFLPPSLGAALPLTPAERAAMGPTALLLGAALLASAAGVVLAAHVERVDVGVLAYALPGFCIALGSGRLMRAVGEDRSAAQLAAGIAPVLGAGGQVLGVATYPPSLPFYLRRTMAVATADGHELTSNYLSTFAPVFRGPASPLQPPDQWRRALDTCPAPTVFVVRAGDAATRTALAALPVIADDGHLVAYGPCRPTGHG